MSKVLLNVGFVRPPIKGHFFRGIGQYYKRLYQALGERSDIQVSEIDINDFVGSYDLLHYPYFDLYFLTLPIIKRKPIVVTIHDLIPLKYPQHFPVGLTGLFKYSLQKYSLLQCKRIITDSASSKKDIVQFIRFDEKKIDVIPLGVGEEFKVVKSKEDLGDTRQKLDLPKKYVLCVSDVNYNKNITNLVKAFSKVNQEFPELHLVLVGRGFATDSDQLRELKFLIDSLKMTDRVMRLDTLSVEDLVALYNMAKIYIQPSLYEGFGLPILEAMSCGVPVISSDRSSLKELSKDAAYQINPEKIDDIAAAIITLYKNPDFVDDFVIMGLKKVKQFSWQKCADQTIKVYREIVG